MTALRMTAYSGIWYVLCLFSIVLVIGGLSALIQGQNCCNKGLIISTLFNMLFCFVQFVAMMDCAQSLRENNDLIFLPVRTILYSQPWILFAGLEAAFGVMLLFNLGKVARFQKTNVTYKAIRETINLLPEGIAVSTLDGVVVLSNLKMNALCRSLTGSYLQDALQFQNYIEEIGDKQNGQILIQTPQGEAWVFMTNRIFEKGMEYELLTAVDMTESYRITEELKKKNARLMEIQDRMKAVVNESGDMFIAREEAAARVSLHNQLGQVLLLARHYLEHPMSTDASMTYMMTKQMNLFLLREAEEPERINEDGLNRTIIMAENIGVKISIHGNIPPSEVVRSLLVQTIKECAANTVKHAGGNELDIKIEDNKSLVSITATNNGEPPKGPIAESGGLLSLRGCVEAAGGEMFVHSTPLFSLELHIPLS